MLKARHSPLSTPHTPQSTLYFATTPIDTFHLVADMTVVVLLGPLSRGIAQRNQLAYDLRKLSAHGLIERPDNRHVYMLCDYGRRAAAMLVLARTIGWSLRQQRSGKQSDDAPISIQKPVTSIAASANSRQTYEADRRRGQPRQKRRTHRTK